MRHVSETPGNSAEKSRAGCSRPSVSGLLVRQVFPLTRELLGGWEGVGVPCLQKQQQQQQQKNMAIEP